MSAATCWSCGVEQSPERPTRADFESEPAYLEAAIVYLDYSFPARKAHRERIAEWERLERERDPAYVVARLRQLIDDDTPEGSAEFERLSDIRKTLKTLDRQREDTK